MPTLSDKQIAGAVKAAGWPKDQWVTAVAVALAESSGRSDVVNSIGASGLFQILRSAHSELFTRYNYSDPVDNATMALIVYRNAGGSWSPWVAYTSGAYRAYLPRARAAAGGPVTPPAVGSGSAGGGTTATPAVSIVPAGFGKRLGYGAVGLLFVFLALMFWARFDKLAANVIPVARVARKVTRR